LSLAHAKVRVAKADLRAAILSERARRSEGERQHAALELRDVVLDLAQVRGIERVGIYVSRAGEPGTGPLRRAFVGRGTEVVVPVIGRSRGLRWLHPGESVADLAQHGRAPWRRTETESGVEVLLVPALAVDTDGRRLGRGCDGYDRILRRLDPRVLVLAVVHDDELLDSAVEEVPVEPHDVRVPAAVTPTRLRTFAADTLVWSAA
jgi:5-formyltetrahydrofolate cyclo-ligase